MKNQCAIIFLLTIFFSLGASAELLLLEKSSSGAYQLINYEKSADQGQLTAIFSEILMPYQWPTVTMYFYGFDPEEKNEYFKYLQEDHGIAEFISNKLRNKYQDRYKVLFVPNTIFEIAVFESALVGRV